MESLPIESRKFLRLCNIAACTFLAVGCFQTENTVNTSLLSSHDTLENESSTEESDRLNATNNAVIQCIVGSTDCDEKVESLSVLFQKGSDANVTDDNGRTPLILEATKGCKSVMDLLLQQGADINYANPYNGETAILRACEYGTSESVQFLLENGADASVADIDGRLPIHLASGHSVDMVELLIGASRRYVNAADKYGVYPLFSAVKSDVSAEEKSSIVKLLLRAGADPRIPLSGIPIPDSTVGSRRSTSRIPKVGESVITYAKRNSMFELARLMSERESLSSEETDSRGQKDSGSKQ